MNNKTIICGVYTFPRLTISVSLLIKNYRRRKEFVVKNQHNS